MSDSRPNKPPQGLYKLTIHAYCRKDISEEQFHNHWTNSHAPKVSSFLRKYGIVGYTQYHTPSWIRKEMAEKLHTLGSFATDNVSDFDGYVELWMPDLRCYEEARKDPYYASVITPDEEEFFDFSRSKITVGWEEVYIDPRKDGEVDASVYGNGS
ncbi:hypothetical protein DOTSEDRAFT_27677 [Dothistroma septosporum NZE10]|uniref:EthD domain-containing protein n=1 Tax=Dothistroma septosporum (strain NZE10 / CBS 128990) TaxID=675120 RepID=N1PHS7_DOTSN|nr:hypothetical protein DOTSEDRAFT_27677 [Dothistroma septosporum NZE10]